VEELLAFHTKAMRQCFDTLAPGALAFRADATVPTAAEEVIRLIRDQFGRLDALVNNVGPFPALSSLEEA